MLLLFAMNFDLVASKELGAFSLGSFQRGTHFGGGGGASSSTFGDAGVGCTLGVAKCDCRQASQSCTAEETARP